MNVTKDSLGNRMKAYESQTTFQKLSPLNPIIARLDGRSFSSFTKGLGRPYDKRLSDLMAETTKFLVKESNANIGYCQSDEITLVWVNKDEKIDQEIFFSGKVFKMTSILASMCSTYFNKLLLNYIPEKADKFPLFDCRVFSVPTITEAINCLYWREKDATKNSISMAAQSVYSHKDLMHKNSKQKNEMLFAKGINWNDYPDYFKKGTYVARQSIIRKFTTDELDKLPEKHEARKNPDLEIVRQDVLTLNIPPLSRIKNKADVLFLGAKPITD